MSDSDIVTTYEGKDGYALVDKAQFEWLRREVDRLKANLVKMENSLCGAVCIIRNEAGLKSLHRNKQGECIMNRWADELIEESGMDFDAALNRVTGPEGPDDFGVIPQTPAPPAANQPSAPDSISESA